MQISVTDAKAQLTELLRRAEAGEKVVLTRHGQPVVRLVPIKTAQERKARRQALSGLTAERYDLLFGAEGLPEWARGPRR